MREALPEILAAIDDPATRARVVALAQELESSEQRLKVALQAAQLVSIISQDLRNPLQTITISAASLERGPSLGEKQVAAIDRIAAAAERARCMVRDLLDFTHAQIGGGLQIARKPIALDLIVARTIEEFHAHHPERAVLVEGSAGELFADEERIAQVVENLLSNANRHSPPGGAISITLAAEKEILLLRIHHDGEPIPAELHKQLFQPLQGGNDRSIGLGLYLAREIVRAHGGTIEASAEGLRGTTFTVQLPRT